MSVDMSVVFGVTEENIALWLRDCVIVQNELLLL